VDPVPDPLLLRNLSHLSEHFLYYMYVDGFLATDPEVPGSIPGATRFSEK
jgi:hypothetical protein